MFPWLLIISRSNVVPDLGFPTIRTGGFISSRTPGIFRGSLICDYVPSGRLACPSSSHRLDGHYSMVVAATQDLAVYRTSPRSAIVPRTQPA